MKFCLIIQFFAQKLVCVNTNIFGNTYSIENHYQIDPSPGFLQNKMNVPIHRNHTNILKTKCYIYMYGV